jgi:hypothetical protein
LERFFFGDILVQHKTMFVTTSQLLVDWSSSDQL